MDCAAQWRIVRRLLNRARLLRRQRRRRSIAASLHGPSPPLPWLIDSSRRTWPPWRKRLVYTPPTPPTAPNS